ncbi:MAG: efflux RND transporter periplasmic adaptor subunit [Nitrospirae bacterium]|nr:efflux RND transporter periplasmic adaptor subunit [Nitrospirota bacterium]
MNIKTITDKIQTMNKKIVYGISITAAIAVLGAGYMIFGKENSYAETPKSEAPVSVSVVIVEQKTIDSVVTAAGALNSRNTSVLSSKVMGRVVRLSVQEGEQVAAGKLLMKIDSGEITAQAIQAKAAYNNARLQYDRIKSLFDAKASTRMEMDQATLGLENAQAGLQAAKAMESYTIISAPISGQIVEKHINLGEMALPGQPLIKIEDNRNLRLEVTLKEQDILSIQPGNPVKVLIDAMPGTEISGRVSQVVQASDVRTHSFIVKIDIPAHKGLITGMYGKAFFTIGKHEAILVPKSAIVEMSGISGVYLVSLDQGAVFQMIQVGDEHENFVEVISGLKQGDQVISDKHLGRLEGRKIIVAQK